MKTRAIGYTVDDQVSEAYKEAIQCMCVCQRCIASHKINGSQMKTANDCSGRVVINNALSRRIGALGSS
jgi:hypothetical protein